MLKNIIILFSILFSFVVLSCSGKSGENVKNKKEKTVSAKNLDQNLEMNEQAIYLTDTARFLAGRDVSSKSKLKKLTNNPAYKKYQKLVNLSWEDYNKKIRSKIAPWRKKNLKGKCSDKVFYPFSGPDILNAVQFFPEAKSYTMMALEPTGPIPDPLKVSAGQSAINNLFYIPKTVNSLLGFSFFRTLSMAVDIGKNDFSGINGILLFFLGRMDYEILDINYIRINEAGKVVTIGKKIPAGTNSDGSSIVFRKKKGAMQKTIIFIRGDIRDGALATKKRFQNFFTALPENLTTQLKAASYLMYRNAFDGIRNTILAKSKCILTDSSGIPFHFINNGYWNLSLYGKYLRPINLFASRFQPDLFVAMKKEKPELLKFSYGYVFGPGRSHIVLAVRASKNKFTKPEFDNNDNVGIASISFGNNFVVTHTYSNSSIAVPVAPSSTDTKKTENKK